MNIKVFIKEFSPLINFDIKREEVKKKERRGVGERNDDSGW